MCLEKYLENLANCVRVHNSRKQFYDFQPFNEPDERLIS